jgi:hypothetical protein
MKTIEVTIYKDGRIESKVKGTSGDECVGFSDWLNKLGEIVIDKDTEDMYRLCYTEKEFLQQGN